MWRFDEPDLLRVPSNPTPTDLYAGSYHAYNPADAHLRTRGDGFLHRVNTSDNSVSTGWTRREETVFAPRMGRLVFDLPHGLVAHMAGDRIRIWSGERIRLERVIDHAWGAGRRTTTAAYLPQQGQVVTLRPPPSTVESPRVRRLQRACV